MKLFLYSFHPEGTTTQVNVMTKQIRLFLHAVFKVFVFDQHLNGLELLVHKVWWTLFPTLSHLPALSTFFLLAPFHNLWFVCGFSVNTQLIALIFLMFLTALGLFRCKGENSFDGNTCVYLKTQLLLWSLYVQE